MRRMLLTSLLCLLMWCPSAAVPATHAAVPALPNTAIPQAHAAASPSCSNNSTIGNKVWTVAISSTLAFLGDGQALTILDVGDPARPTCRSHLALPPNRVVSAIVLRGNYAYLSLSNFNETDIALQIVDVHDPDNPTLLGSFNGSNGQDLVVVGNLLYLAASFALKVIDVSNPAAPALVYTYTQSYPSKMQIVGNRLYMITGPFAFDIVDLANPTHPVRLGGFYEGTGYLYYSFSVAGDRAYLVRQGSGIAVLDVSHPNNPRLINTYTDIPNINSNRMGIQVIGTTLYIAGAKFELYDISSPTKASLIGSYDAPGIGYDMWLAGDLAYVVGPESGAQTGDYGFEIIDLSNHVNPFLRGWFLNGNTGRFFYMSSLQR